MSIRHFIARGEVPRLEFKSSIRWDPRTQAVNKELERVVAKTTAGFVNHGGGTLVVGVTDEGSIVGVERATQTLTKKPTQDGLALHITEILTKYLGAADAPRVATVVRLDRRQDGRGLEPRSGADSDLRRQRGCA